MLDPHALVSGLLEDERLREHLSKLRTETGLALGQAGFQVLNTRALQTAAVGPWVQLSAELLVCESVHGHALAVRLIWALDTRPGQVGAGVLWAEAASPERDADKRLPTAIARENLGMTAGLAVLPSVETVQPVLLQRLLAVRAVQSQQVARFIHTLVTDALAP